jgi:hypothetical protein
VEFSPLLDAIARLGEKTPIGSALRTADWEGVPLALRERAQFSAGVENARLLQAIQDRMLGQVQMQRERLANGETAIFDRSSFIDAIRQIAIEEGVETIQSADEIGTVRDIRSIPRLGLIYDTQLAQAQGFARYKLDNDDGALLLYPAQRLSESTANKPREDWPERWEAAGNATGWEGALQNDFVALKTSPIWAALSRFGTPWPPFDFGSTREIEDVDWETAKSLGLVKDGDVPKSSVPDFNTELESSVAGLDPEYQRKLELYFGDQVEITDGAARWTA